MGQAVIAAGFLVRHEDQPQTQRGRHLLPSQLFGQQEHADDGLLVVLHAAPVKPVAFAPDLPGVGSPGGGVARRHHISVAEKPERAGIRTGQAGHQVRAQPVRHALVRRVQPLQIAHAAGLQPARDQPDLGQLAPAAVVRPQSLAGRERALQFHHALVPLRQSGQQTVQFLMFHNFVRQ